MKKALGICSIIAGLVLIAKEVLSKIEMNIAIKTIGGVDGTDGVDGPTAVFVAEKLGGAKYSGLVASVLLLVIGIVLVFWKRNK